MKTIHLELNLKHSFGNLERGQHVLIVCLDHHNRVLLGAKPDFYPPNIYRLIGGGLDPGESPIQTAQRELQEELGIKTNQDKLKQIYKVVIEATVNQTIIKFVTHIYFLTTKLDPATFTYQDDIARIEPMTLPQLQQLIHRYSQFSPDHYLLESDGYKHYWIDYGQVYGPIHQLVYDYLQQIA